jgi:hypothetical protein
VTPRTNARLAGAAFLVYIAAGVGGMVLSGRTLKGAEGAAAKLAAIAMHPTAIGLTVLLSLVMVMCAVVLGVTLYALTREEDRDLALLAMCCRLTEGAIGAVGMVSSQVVHSAAGGGITGAEAASAAAVAGLLLATGSAYGAVAAIAFAFGSLLFASLFVRSRSIPAWLAWLGVAASALLVVVLPLGLAGFVSGPITNYVWGPMAVFEVILAGWLIGRGVRPRAG